MNEGKVNRGDGKPWEVTVKDLWNDLGTTCFDGNEKEVVLKNGNNFEHYFLNEKWKAILVVSEPIITNENGLGGVGGTAKYSVLIMKSPFYKPFTYWQNSRSLLVFTEDGFSGIINGTTGIVPILNAFGMNKLVNPTFTEVKTKNGKSLMITCDAPENKDKKYFEMPFDSNGNLTLEMRLKEKVTQ